MHMHAPHEMEGGQRADALGTQSDERQRPREQGQQKRPGRLGEGTSLAPGGKTKRTCIRRVSFTTSSVVVPVGVDPLLVRVLEGGRDQSAKTADATPSFPLPPALLAPPPEPPAPPVPKFPTVFDTVPVSVGGLPV